MIVKSIRTFSAVAIIIITGIVILLTAQSFERPGTAVNEIDNDNTLVSNKPYKLPENVYFAGERMPLENIDTRESLEREILTTAYRHSSTILIIKRANRFLPVIEKILGENSIPDDLKYLVAAESEFSNMISPAGATGYWQIMAATGREQGMEINNEVDERYSIEKSTRFACEYLRKSYEKFGNWTLAAASYNGGRAAIDEQVSIQKQNNYYDLLLAEETARYIFRVVAYKLVISDPAAYGFEIGPEDLYPPFDHFTVVVDTPVDDFSDFALKYGTSYKILKLLNPWLRKPYLSNRNGKKYEIKIPTETMRASAGAGY